VKNVLGGDDGFKKCASTGGRDVLPMPHENLGGCLVNEGLHIAVFNTSRSERQSNIFYWEVERLIGKLCMMSSRSSWEHLIGGAILLCIFVTGYLPETFQNICKNCKIFFVRRHEKIVASLA
jgi:hypothetical protein